jgi:uncharacterized protein
LNAEIGLLYHDEIYGAVTISEPVFQDLLASAAVTRLRGIYQGGISGLLRIAPDFSRYDHSVGVCVLLRRLGAPLAEQIAGLLHDVSHTAFSHVADFVFERADQAYHEDLFESTIAESDLPAILSRHGYDWHDLLDETRYPLLEQPLPRLCADRLDYFFRDAVGFGWISLADVTRCLDSLLVREGRIGVAGEHGHEGALDLAPARWLASTFMYADDHCWSDLRELSLYRLTADAIRAAWSAGCTSEADLLGTDRPLWECLQRCPDPGVAAALVAISPATCFELDPAAPDFMVVPKVRAIDPEVWADGCLRPLSMLDPEFAAARAAYLARKDHPWPVRIIK